MKRIAIYYRVSTKKQDFEIQEAAFATWLRGYAEPARVYKFQDKRSGNAKSRAGYDSMMALARAGKLDLVVTYSIDRFSRNRVAGLSAVLELSQLSVGFHSLTQPFLSTLNPQPFQNVLFAAFTEIAQIERETIVRRVKDGMAVARAKGKQLGKPTKLTREMHVEMLRMRNTPMVKINSRGQTVISNAGIREIAAHFGVGHSLVERALAKSLDSDIQYAR